MILEGIVTSLDSTDEVNIAPMGPSVERPVTSLRLRPFKTSRTYQNLKQLGQGVFHVTDDVLLLARAAIGDLFPKPELFPAEKVKGHVLQKTCRWYEFEVESIDDAQERADIRCKVVHVGRIDDFIGFNRAKHAVLEAAILATRVHMMPRDFLQKEFDRLQVLVQKTAGLQEIEAFELLCKYLARQPAT